MTVHATNERASIPKTTSLSAAAAQTLCVNLTGPEAAAELAAGRAEREGEPLGVHTQPPAAADGLPGPGERVSEE